MLENRTVAVVIPAYNEEAQIRMVLETMPDFVDRMIVVNDCSTDKTEEIVRSLIEKEEKYGSDQIGPRKVVQNLYNEAEMVLQAYEETEITYFISSEVVNPDPDYSRIILINLAEWIIPSNRRQLPIPVTPHLLPR